MKLQEEIRQSLRARVLGEDVLAESKSVSDWWDKLPGKRRQKVVEILGMSKGKDNKLYANLSVGEQEEIGAYFKKHKGKVEGINVEPGVILSEANGPSAPYRSLNDAEKVTGNPVYKKGRTEIWYMTKAGWQRFSTGGHRGDTFPSVTDPGNLGTHKLLGSISATDKEQIFIAMQAEMWSPQGQARNLIMGKGLVHTSMSVGDVIRIGNRAWMVDMAGFKELGKGKSEGVEEDGDALMEMVAQAQAKYRDMGSSSEWKALDAAVTKYNRARADLDVKIARLFMAFHDQQSPYLMEIVRMLRSKMGQQIEMY